jgi:hypothetical protein
MCTNKIEARIIHSTNSCYQVAWITTGTALIADVDGMDYTQARVGRRRTGDYLNSAGSLA